MFMERGGFLGGGVSSVTGTTKGLDLRSPQTKFNLMRKLQEVKEQYGNGGYGDGGVIEENHLEE